MDLNRIIKLTFICLFTYCVLYNLDLFYTIITHFIKYPLLFERMFTLNTSYCVFLEKYKYTSSLGYIVFRILLLIYLRSLFPLLFNKKSREQTKVRNTRLNKLRMKPIKTPDEQKEFLDLRYPKKPPFQWTVKNLLLIFLNIFKFIFMIIVLGFVLDKLLLIYPLWFVILMSMCVPYVLNLILSNYNIETDNVLNQLVR